MKKFLFLCALVVGWGGMVQGQSSHSPYAGQEKQAIKALSKERVEGLLAGQGIGYAKAAELNHYPGPRHVLDMAQTLGISPDQTKAIQRIFDAMQKRAIELGKQIVQKEKRLDELFASKRIGPQKLAPLTEEIGRLDGTLRAIHLQAHLDATALLTPSQVEAYDNLRGYGGSAGSKKLHQPGMEAHHGGNMSHHKDGGMEPGMKHEP